MVYSPVKASAAFLIVVALNACGGASTVAGTQPVVPAVRKSTPVEQVIYGFGATGDSYYPETSLVNVKHTLYGTTANGGAYGFGAVFAISQAWHETLLYSFKGAPDGAQASPNLLNINGTLYGTTYSGGAYNNGTVFSITPSGEERVLYSFMGSFSGEDGAGPNGGLINVGNTLYGTTNSGGISGGSCSPECGTVFGVTAGGKEKILYRFQGGSDGTNPEAGLMYVKGTLYGTTPYGGGTGCGVYGEAGPGCGTVYSVVAANGAETVLHHFTGAPDGARPVASLIEVTGTLYGTTQNGGPYCTEYGPGFPGCGTVFSIDVSGNENVVYSFEGPPDGATPAAKLLDVDGTLYGTTVFGGATVHGTVFAIPRSAKESVLYSFLGRNGSGLADGAYPHAGLLYLNGALYGTTYQGGDHTMSCGQQNAPRYGCGTIFRVTAGP